MGRARDKVGRGARRAVERGAAAGPGLDPTGGAGAAERHADRHVPRVGDPGGEPDDERVEADGRLGGLHGLGREAAQGRARGGRAGTWSRSRGACGGGSNGVPRGRPRGWRWRCSRGAW